MFKRNTDGVETRWRDGMWPELLWLTPPPGTDKEVRRAVPCPTCKAEINVRCVYTGRRKLDVHAARRKLFEEKQR